MAGRPATLILGMVFVLLLAGCAQGDTSADTSVAASTSSTTTVAPTVDSTTTSTVAATTVTAAATTTTTIAATTTTDPETTATTVPHTDQVLPGSFGTIAELYRGLPSGRSWPNAQVVASLGFAVGEDDTASEVPPEWDWGSLTITYFEDLTVYDYEGGHREVRPRGGWYLVLADDGSWHEADDGEASMFAPVLEWEDVQNMARGCIEAGAEVVGLEESVGVTTLHIRCGIDGGDRGGVGSADVWIDEGGYVMRTDSEFWEEPQFGMGVRWEVIGLDVEPSGPLPPDWMR
jgi:hypothetical protein